MSLYKNSISDLFQLSTDNIYSIDKIEWWLLKYSELYETSKCECGLHFIEHTEQMGEEGLNQFKCLYDDLTKLADIHKLEPFFKNLLDEYALIKNDLEYLIRWMRKYENLYDEYEFQMLHSMENRDSFDLSHPLSHIKQYLYTKDESEYLLLDCKDFKNILEFTKLFNHLFWTEKLLPERIKAIEDDIKRSNETIV